jgi:ribosomal protein S18 acetylase RimI-like enzyme
MEDRVNVRTMVPEDANRAIATVVLSFAADPMTRWVWPQAHQYLTVMPMTIRAFGGAAFAQDTAFCSDSYAGAALWLRPGVHADEKRLGELMESTGSPDGMEARSAIFEQMAQHHPKEAHWYLPLIGVDPAHQRRGHGDALMRYALERVDRENGVAYLESSNPRNISFYRRHGFEEIGAIQAGSSPVLVPMLRRPR